MHEGGIAEQRHAPEHGLRRFEIEDRLEERLRRAGEDFGDLGRDEDARAVALIAAVISGRINGGGIAVPWHRPVASVQRSTSVVSRSVGRYQTML